MNDELGVRSWELNDLARRLDEQDSAVELYDSQIAAPPEGAASQLSLNARRMLSAVEKLPANEREVFDLVRIESRIA